MDRTSKADPPPYEDQDGHVETEHTTEYSVDEHTTIDDIDDHTIANDVDHYSALPPRQSGKPPMGALYFGLTDGLGVIDFSPACIDSVRDSITQVWDKGINRETRKGAGVHFKLNGYPWQGSGADSVKVRRLVRHILASLHSLGWKLHLSTNVSRVDKNKDCLIFRFDPNHQPNMTYGWFIIAFSSTDRVRLIDAPEDIINGVAGGLPCRKGNKKNTSYDEVHDFTLTGRPFSNRAQWGNPVPEGATIALFLAGLLEDQGCSIYASIKQKDSSGNAEGAGTDTWHVIRPVPAVGPSRGASGVYA